MAMATNFIILSIVLTVFSTFMGAGLNGVPGLGVTTFPTTPLGAIIAFGTTGQIPSDFPAYPIFALILSGSVVAFIGTVIFPNQFAIFLPITAALLTTFLVVPYDLFYAILPAPFNILLTAVFGFQVLWGFLNWYKGGGEP